MSESDYIKFIKSLSSQQVNDGIKYLKELIVKYYGKI